MIDFEIFLKNKFNFTINCVDVLLPIISSIFILQMCLGGGFGNPVFKALEFCLIGFLCVLAWIRKPRPLSYKILSAYAVWVTFYLILRSISVVELHMYDLSFLAYPGIFLLILLGFDNVKCRPIVVIMPIVLTFAFIIGAYSFQIPEHSFQRLKLCIGPQECLDPTLLAVTFSCTAIVLGLLYFHSFLPRYALFAAALALSIMIESRTAILTIIPLLALAFLLDGRCLKNLVIAVVFTIFFLLIFGSVSIAKSYYYDDQDSYKPPIKTVIALYERFLPKNVAIEESASPVARLQIYNDFQRNGINSAAALHGYQPSSTLNPHNEYLRAYQNGGVALLIFFIGTYTLLIVKLKKNLEKLIASIFLLPSLFYGFNYFDFYPIFLILLLRRVRPNASKPRSL